jgi:hypothetical protein
MTIYNSLIAINIEKKEHLLFFFTILSNKILFFHEYE